MIENKKSNDLFFICSLIEYIARKTKNTKRYITEKLGRDNIQKLYDLADIYHSENIDKIADELIMNCKIENGNYDILKNIQNENPPSYFDIGKVYKRLIKMCSNNNPKYYIDNLIKIMTSWIIEHIDNYDSSLYFENPEYIYECFLENKIL